MVDVDHSKYRILITDDDDDARMVLRLMVERDGYQVIEAKDGLQAIEKFEEYEPDVILMDCMMPNLDGFSTVERIRQNPRGKDIPIVMVTALNDDGSVQRGFKVGASDYISKPVQVALMRQRLHRLIRTKAAEDGLRQVIEDQKILHRIDREIGYTLNLERVLSLTLDTVMRRTAASSCVVGWINITKRQLERLAGLGSNKILTEPILQTELTTPDSPLALVFNGDQPLYETKDGLFARLMIPLVIQGKVKGVIAVEGVVQEYYNQTDLDFLVHLASRTAEAIEKTQVYQKSHDYNVMMDRLNEINTAISSSLNREDMVEMSTRGLAVLLGGSSAMFFEYDARETRLTLKSSFVVEGMADKLPELGTTYTPSEEFVKRTQDGVLQFQPYGEGLEKAIGEFSKAFNYQAGVVVSISTDNKLSAIIVMGESRYERFFSVDELALARSLGVHVMVMFQQAKLYSNIKDLEEVKSEMIRMASHDLKNPLLQVQGYLDLFVKTLKVDLDDQQKEFLVRVRSGTKKMNDLLEDILNLERIESHMTMDLHEIDLHKLVLEIFTSLKPQADIKAQTFTLNLTEERLPALGNEIQIRQAITNFVGNAIKYTPDEGEVVVEVKVEKGEFKFKVTDSGYGIPKDRQSKLFERFYRARTPGTEDIPGTGLGLSLVKTVIERHGGSVWFESEEGAGSTFGLNLPLKR